MVSLKSKLKRTKVVNLPHQIVCSEDSCACEEKEHRGMDLDPKTGEVAVRILARQICASVHLLPGVWSAPLPDDSVKVPEIAALIKQSKLEARTE